MIDFEIVANFESPFGHGGAADVKKCYIGVAVDRRSS